MEHPTDRDLTMMKRAIRLSKRGFPAPNPHVGCVISQGDTIVGEGYHHYAGAPHAEIEALSAAGPRAAGATAYVTLEPCSHHGRTPPCTEALLAAKVSRVVVACLDPNPIAAGGLAKLCSAGVEVASGLLESEAADANNQFLTAITLKRPRIVLKAAMSLDGRIALPNGESKWLTSTDARRQAHRLRAECGAVLVGRRTVETDDPALTARIPGVENQPIRVVLDPGARLHTRWRVFDGSAPTLHIVNGTFGLRAGQEGFDLAELCGALFTQGITGLMVEGGAVTISLFVKSRLFDRVELFVAPKLLGDGHTWIEGLGLAKLSDGPALKVVSLKKLKEDVQISLRQELGN